MYHAMFPTHMVVQVGQQGHYHPHFLDAAQRQSRVGHNVSLPHNPYEHAGGSPIELLQLFGFEVPGMRSGMSYNGRVTNSNVNNSSSNNNQNNNNNSNNINNHNSSSAVNNGSSGAVNGVWRECNSAPVNHMMAPPPAALGRRPISNCPMKRVYWNKGSNRSGTSRESSSSGASSEAYSSDSGFSSRSPTPSSQQVSPSSSKSGSSFDDDTLSAAGEPAPIPSKSLNTENKNKRQEANGQPNYHQPYFQHSASHNGHMAGHHHNTSHHHHQIHPQHQTQGYHHLNPSHHHTPIHQPQRRSESLTSLNNQCPANGYQSKRRYHSGRHSPPAMYRNSSRGRRMPGGTAMRSSLPTLSMPGFSAPERFLQRSHLLYITDKPDGLLVSDEWDEVTEAMWSKFIRNQQTEEMYRNKMELWKRLYYCIRFSFPRYGLFLVGSTISGFGSNKSDMDMCLLVRHSEMDQRSEAVGHLEDVLKCLRQCTFLVNVDLIQAKVPILKFRDAEHNLEVDLNCNNAVGIRNTHMLFCYSQMDWRVRPLVIVVKLWAAQQGINDAKNMTISSYSLVLMVINFLQCGVSPPVLPCLHTLYPGKFMPHSDPHTIDLHEELPTFKSENTQPLGQLLLAFLEYYAHFDYSQDAVSVRTASRLPIEDCRHARSYKNEPHQWKYLCIEEPFDLTNTAHSVYDPEAFEKIKDVFEASYQALKETRSLESIFNIQQRNE